MSFLLDTDICSARARNHTGVFGRFIQYSGRLSVSRITIAELYVWVHRADPASRPRKAAAVEQLLQDVTVIEIDDEVCRTYGSIQADQIARGAIGPRMDMLIAACALVHDLVLVTGNVNDFTDIDGLTIQNWLA